MWKGFEGFLKNKHPLDATRICQRICGVENALSIEINKTAKVIRFLILGANYIQLHVLHFYHLSLLDYVDLSRITGEIGPFYPFKKRKLSVR